MRITVDIERCVGAAQCVLAAPDVFDQDDDGLVVLLTSDPSDTKYDAVRDAARHCPSSTISLAENRKAPD
jgi:ferredoxin